MSRRHVGGRKEEMDYMRKQGVFEVVDEKGYYDNGCKPLTLKWVEKMKGDVCRSRSVGKPRRPRRTMNTQMLPSEDAGVHDDARTRRWKSHGWTD